MVRVSGCLPLAAFAALLTPLPQHPAPSAQHPPLCRAARMAALLATSCCLTRT
jgi:hypothetical protein